MIAIKAITLHTFGVQVVFRVSSSTLMVLGFGGMGLGLMGLGLLGSAFGNGKTGVKCLLQSSVEPFWGPHFLLYIYIYGTPLKTKGGEHIYIYIYIYIYMYVYNIQ